MNWISEIEIPRHSIAVTVTDASGRGGTAALPSTKLDAALQAFEKNAPKPVRARLRNEDSYRRAQALIRRLLSKKVDSTKVYQLATAGLWCFIHTPGHDNRAVLDRTLNQYEAAWVNIFIDDQQWVATCDRQRVDRAIMAHLKAAMPDPDPLCGPINGTKVDGGSVVASCQSCCFARD